MMQKHKIGLDAILRLDPGHKVLWEVLTTFAFDRLRTRGSD